MTDSKYAPFCIGMSIVYDSYSPKCNNCQYEKQCASECVDSLVTIHQQTDVSDFLLSIKQRGVKIEIETSPNTFPRAHKTKKAKRKRVKTLSLQCLTSLDGLPKNAQTIVSQLLFKEINLLEEILNQRNPFCGEKPAYLEGVCDVLLTGRYSREKMLKGIHKICPAWGENTLRSHFGAVTKALLAMDIIERDGDHFIVKGYQWKN